MVLVDLSEAKMDEYSDALAEVDYEYNVNYDYLMYGEGEMFDDLPQTIVDEVRKILQEAVNKLQ